VVVGTRRRSSRTNGVDNAITRPLFVVWTRVGPRHLCQEIGIHRIVAGTKHGFEPVLCLTSSVAAVKV
jgi:hypothetical protein